MPQNCLSPSRNLLWEAAPSTRRPGKTPFNCHHLNSSNWLEPDSNPFLNRKVTTRRKCGWSFISENVLPFGSEYSVSTTTPSTSAESWKLRQVFILFICSILGSKMGTAVAPDLGSVTTIELVDQDQNHVLHSITSKKGRKFFLSFPSFSSFLILFLFLFLFLSSPFLQGGHENWINNSRSRRDDRDDRDYRQRGEVGPSEEEQEKRKPKKEGNPRRKEGNPWESVISLSLS